MSRVQSKAKSKRAATDTVVVHGGTKCPPMAPSRELGEYDPELDRMLAEAAKRYHLDTLRVLDEEAFGGDDPIATLLSARPSLVFR